MFALKSRMSGHSLALAVLMAVSLTGSWAQFISWPGLPDAEEIFPPPSPTPSPDTEWRCDTDSVRWEEGYTLEGTVIGTPVVDKLKDCGAKCYKYGPKNGGECNAAIFNYDKKKCYLMDGATWDDKVATENDDLFVVQCQVGEIFWEG